jgi:hypothetical protein
VPLYRSDTVDGGPVPLALSTVLLLYDLSFG